MFMSIEEFMTLRDPTERPPRTIHRKPYTGEGWIKLYNIAKASYEKYGLDGPPVGSKVLTLVSGFGGGAGEIRLFNGAWPDDTRFFTISHAATALESIVLRSHWWCQVKPYEGEDWKQLDELLKDL